MIISPYGVGSSFSISSPGVDSIWYAGSCIIRIPEGQVGFSISDCVLIEVISSNKSELSGTTIVPPIIWTRFAQFNGGTNIDWLNGKITSNTRASHGMPATTDLGRWYIKYFPSKDEFPITGGGAPPILRTFNDSVIGTVDYKGDDIIEEHVSATIELPNGWTPEKNGTASAYVDSSGVTDIITGNLVIFTVDNRTSFDVTRDLADIKISDHIPGAFRYTIQKRIVGETIWGGLTDGTIESFEDPLERLQLGETGGGIIEPGEDYEFRINIQTSQGTFNGTNIVTLLAI